MEYQTILLALNTIEKILANFIILVTIFSNF